MQRKKKERTIEEKIKYLRIKLSNEFRQFPKKKTVYLSSSNTDLFETKLFLFLEIFKA